MNDEEKAQANLLGLQAVVENFFLRYPEYRRQEGTLMILCVDHPPKQDEDLELYLQRLKRMIQ